MPWPRAFAFLQMTCYPSLQRSSITARVRKRTHAIQLHLLEATLTPLHSALSLFNSSGFPSLFFSHVDGCDSGIMLKSKHHQKNPSAPSQSGQTRCQPGICRHSGRRNVAMEAHQHVNILSILIYATTITYNYYHTTIIFLSLSLRYLDSWKAA